MTIDVIRREVQGKYEQIILLDPDVANKHNVEQLLWKSAFYQVIEVLRKHSLDMSDEDTNKAMNAALLELLDEVVLLYSYGTMCS